MSTPTIASPVPAPVSIEPAEHSGKHAVIGGGLGRLAYQQHPSAEGSTDLRMAQSADHHRSWTNRQPGRLGEGRVRPLELRIGDDAHDHGRAQHIDHGGKPEPDQRGRGNVALGFSITPADTAALSIPCRPRARSTPRG